MNLVPKKGLEPPHPCGYMDLNHARLPIPPLRHGEIQREIGSSKRTKSASGTALNGQWFHSIASCARQARGVPGRWTRCNSWWYKGIHSSQTGPVRVPGTQQIQETE